MIAFSMLVFQRLSPKNKIMKRNCLPFLLVINFLFQPWAMVIAQQKVGIFDGHTDVGTNVKPGSATFIPQTGQYVINGRGL